jgi:hypothetical protein
MSVKSWEPIKYCYCNHIQHNVALEVEMVYPAEWLPDQAPRVLAHRCSHALACNLDGRSSCIWSGTNPAIDPFIENLAPPI